MLTHILVLDIGERARDTLVGVVHRLVDGRTVLGREAVLLVPDVERRFLERNGVQAQGIDLDHSVHVSAALRMLSTPCSTDCRECQPKRLRRRSMSREPDRYLLPEDSQVPETSPDRVTLDRCSANTRSCVGVKSLMSVRGCVKHDNVKF